MEQIREKLLHGDYTSVEIDSRKVQPGSLFVALKGNHVDGADYIDDAIRRGATGIISSRKDAKTQRNSLGALASLREVSDSLQALQDLARDYLDSIPNLLRIGITGSVGKTTVKEITGSIFRQAMPTAVSPGNMNSETGLPLAAFKVKPTDKAAIFEMASDHPGEMAGLAQIVRPSIACITLIGTAHIEMFGTKEKILEEKKDIFSLFDKNDIALIPAWEPMRDQLARGLKGRVIYYGNILEAKSEETGYTWEGKPVSFALSGAHNWRNAIAAASIAQAAGIDDETIVKGLEAVQPIAGRSEIVDTILAGKHITLIRDYYNANPDSLNAAFDLIAGLDADKPVKRRKVYVLGSMLELGAFSREAHRNAGRRLAAMHSNAVFLFGKEMEDAAGEILDEKAGPVFWTCDMDTLKDALFSSLQDNDIVLIKGSRACALERIENVS
ncbi:MAG: UDP-N-acetylmuramoyl-tripeptide--D-alanyl-D-alanine ligase [Spirochaetaceae bacterium]|jgi:UDP-N-acetylmuramoyl-tripeptide--D-alanyl-D-alanine ligase|nr:UDP-N-acetylmuramoyl-tripeptide--D-alanyl-D-alanine ligase [Spirochaetaceae bacterium]